MKFQEAVENLSLGNYVMRDSWENECGYLVELPGVMHFLKVVSQPEPKVTSWAATREDSKAEDWKVIVPAHLRKGEEVSVQ